MAFGDGEHPKHDLGQTLKGLNVALEESGMFKVIGEGDEGGFFGGPYPPDPTKVAKAEADAVVLRDYIEFNEVAKNSESTQAQSPPA